VWKELDGSVFLAQNKKWTERNEIRDICAYILSSSHDSMTCTAVCSQDSVGKFIQYRQKERQSQLPTKNCFSLGSRSNTLDNISFCLLIRKLPSLFTIGIFFLPTSSEWLPLKTAVSEVSIKRPTQEPHRNTIINKEEW
jgi:hypothetical protein